MINGSMYLYLYRVAKCLPCKGRVKHRILSEVRRNILSCQEDNGKPAYSEICARLGGGGHKGAAGCRADCGYEEIKERILASVKKSLDGIDL